MKRVVPGLFVVAVLAMLLPMKAWGVQAQHVYAWGEPLSSSSSRYEYKDPTVVKDIPGTVVQISATNSTSYALTKSGEVWAWGAGQWGTLGNGISVKYRVRPVRVEFPAGVKISSLPYPMPYDVGMAIDTHGNVWGWGYNLQFPLCLKEGLVLHPTKLPFAHVTLATGAGWHALYESAGKLYACGRNDAGELGDGSVTDSAAPVRVIGLPSQRIKALVSSWEDSGVLLSNGAFYDWGYNGGDQLGNGTKTNSDVPVRVNLPGPVSQVSMGGSVYYNGQTVAILADGSVWAWGTDQYGQLGIGKVVPSAGPTLVDVPHGVTFVQANSGGSAMYAIDKSGATWAWGINNLHQLGVADVKSSDVPVRIGVNLSAVSSTAANVAGLLETGNHKTR
jgi:alpha-tubulin suppressor-like RCC1 family protein